ncbi:MAG: OB-fold nucleic acid binding domain-containing protein [Candidatus Woesearchaeota archaeon]
MIQIPLADVLSKIKEKTGLSDEEINSRIALKLKQLSGLISREGAAHIVANELGVKLFENLSGKLQIKNILAGMRDVETIGKVLFVNEPREFQSENRSGKVGSIVIGDETGTIRIVCWGNQADKMSSVVQDNIVKIKGGYVRENNGIKEVHLNDRGLLMVNPKGETVGEVKSQALEKPARKTIKELQENDNNVEVLGTIVQAFEPKFYEVCPQCNKRLKQSDSGFVCDQHSSVVPSYAYVLNLFLDDGTENIRVVFFRDQVEKLVSKSKELMLSMRDKPEEFETLKTELLGNIIKVSGRVTKNQMFDRLELVARSVDPSPNPQEEIDRLKPNDG